MMPLRRLEEPDLETMLKWRNHPSVRKVMFNQNVIDLEHHLKWFEEESKRPNSTWLVYCSGSGEPAGIVYFTEVDSVDGSGNWGFYTAPEAPPGTGTKMGFEALDYFFLKEGFSVLYGKVLDNNAKSRRFHEKLCFKVSSIYKDQYRDPGGCHQDVIQYSLSASDWKEARMKLASGLGLPAYKEDSNE